MKINSLQPLYSPADNPKWAVANAKWNLHSELIALMKQWAVYLKPLRERPLVLKWDYIYSQTAGWNRQKIIDLAKSTEKEKAQANPNFVPKNSILRELTYLMASTDGEVNASDPRVKLLAKILCRVAYEEDLRKYLRNNFMNKPVVIKASLPPSRITQDIEADCKTLYEESIQELWFDSEELSILDSLSWWEKSTYSHCPFACKLWIIIQCIANMINLDKPQIK